MRTEPPVPPTKIPAPIPAPPIIISVAPGARLLNRRAPRKSACTVSAGVSAGVDERARKVAPASISAWYGLDWASPAREHTTTKEMRNVVTRTRALSIGAVIGEDQWWLTWPPNESRLSCGALKKDSLHNLRAPPASSAC